MIATPIPRETLLHVVKTLPAAPRILSELGHLLLDPNSDMDEVTSLLRRDTALTARIIRISNSAFYNAGHPYASLDEALARVGYMEVYRLTGFAAVAQVAEVDLAAYGVTGAQLRENSLLTALVMEALAPLAGIEPRLAYTAGLMRSIGKIALDRLARGGGYSSGQIVRASGPLAEWESNYFGMTNCEVAAVILKEWRFPATTIGGIRGHYLIEPQPDPLAQLLNLAAGASERGGHDFLGESSYWATLPAPVGTTEISADDLDDSLRQALELFGPVRAAVG